MKTRRARKRHWMRGAAVVEMALLLPILIMLTFGVIDYGYYFYVRNTFQSAAHAGVRAAVRSSATNSDVTTVVSDMLGAAGLSSSQYTLTLNPSDVSSASSGTTLQVTITATWGNCGTHMLGSSWGGISSSKSITATASMIKS